MFCVRIILSWFALCFLARVAHADYSCLCNDKIATPMFGVQNVSSAPIGYMQEYACKPFMTTNGESDSWNAIMNKHKIAFVQKSDYVNVHVCKGNVPSEDNVITTPGSNLTAKIPASTMTNVTTTGMSTTMSNVATTMQKRSTSSTALPLQQTTTMLPKLTSSIQYLPTTADSGNLNLCPKAITTSNDSRWIRQYKQFCYEIVANRYEDWYEALNDCRNRDGTLLEIYTADIQQFIVQFLKEENYIHPMWIGLQDVDKEETFDHWETDTPLTYENFDPNRKNNYANHAQENCVLLELSGLWDDSVCDDNEANQAERDGHPGLLFRHSWICQYSTTNRQTTTTPAPTSLITDVTGNLQLCPSAVRQSTEPGLIKQYQQYCYEIVPRYEDWYEANQYCHERGKGLNGLLIEFYTQDIENFIKKALSDEGYTHPVWIGLQDVDKEESFDHWESDTPLTYENFDPNRKNNYANHAQENCVLLEPSGFWDDSVCDNVEANQAERDGHPGLPFRHPWICQYPIIHQQPIVVG